MTDQYFAELKRVLTEFDIVAANQRLIKICEKRQYAGFNRNSGENNVSTRGKVYRSFSDSACAVLLELGGEITEEYHEKKSAFRIYFNIFANKLTTVCYHCILILIIHIYIKRKIR